MAETHGSFWVVSYPVGFPENAAWEGPFASEHAANDCAAKYYAPYSLPMIAHVYQSEDSNG